MGAKNSKPPETVKETETIVRNEIKMKINVSNQNIIKSVNEVTNETSTNIEQIVDAKSTSSTSASNTNVLTGDELIGSSVDISQDSTVNAKNASIQKITTDAAAFQQFTTELASKVTNKVANDAKLKQDADILNTFKEKSEKSEGIASMVNNMVSGITGIFKQPGGTIEKARTHATTIFEQEMTVNNVNVADLSNKIKNVVKNNLKQEAIASCITTTSASNINKIDYKKVKDSVIVVKQKAAITALNSCIQDLNLGAKVATEITGKTNFDSLQEIQNKLDAEQKGKVVTEVSKETKTTDAIADVLGKFADSFGELFKGLGAIVPMIVMAVVGVGLVIFLIIIIPMLRGNSRPPPPDYYGGGYTDTFIDSITSIGNNLVAGGENNNFDIVNIYFICIFVIIFFVVKKYIPEC
jgi:hypothetical protein